MQGIWTRNENGETLMFSPFMRGIFFNTSGTFINDSTIPTNFFLPNFGIATPTEPFEFQRALETIKLSASGHISINAANYFEPRLFLISGFNYFGEARMEIEKRPSFVYSFGNPPPPPANDYGFRALGQTLVPDQFVSVDSRNKSFYLQPTSSGTKIRSATVSSLPSAKPTLPQDFYQQQTEPNILFDREYDVPPLIFVTNTTGPVALNFMARNANGKYYGMSVVAESSFTDDLPWGLGAFQSNTYSFNYFILSQQEPIFGSQSNHGIQVFGSSGEKVFDSSYFVPTFFRNVITIPNLIFENIPAEISFEFRQLSFVGPIGVCLNNINTGTGIAFYGSSGVPGFTFAPYTYTGNFLEVNNGVATVWGRASNAVWGLYGPETAPLGIPHNYKWRSGTVNNTMSLFFATYEFNQ